MAFLFIYVYPIKKKQIIINVLFQKQYNLTGLFDKLLVVLCQSFKAKTFVLKKDDELARFLQICNLISYIFVRLCIVPSI